MTVQTPRRSRAEIIAILFLLIVSALLIAFTHWGWQRHVNLL